MKGIPRHLRAREPKPTRRTAILAAAVTVGSAWSGQPDRPLVPDSPALYLSGFPAENLQPADAQLQDPLQAAPESPGQGGTGKQMPPSRTEIISAFAARIPRYWGLEAPGVLTRLPEEASGIMLTVDFCGGPGGNGYDQALVTALRDRRTPAVLFLNSRWIAANAALARELAADPLFELANHGTTHRPLSSTGKAAYGIPGTRNAGEVYDEVMTNDTALTRLTGTRSRFFRPGTAYLDEVAAGIVGQLGLTPIGFSINGDGGATYPAATVAQETSKARTGDIILCHGNHPGSGTSEGIARALDTLAANGARFVPIP